MRHKSSHLSTDLLAKSHPWPEYNRMVMFQIIILADSPNSVKTIMRRIGFFTKIRRKEFEPLARLKRDQPSIFWSMPEVLTAFSDLPKIQGIDIKKVIMRTLNWSGIHLDQ